MKKTSILFLALVLSIMSCTESSNESLDQELSLQTETTSFAHNIYQSLDELKDSEWQNIIESEIPPGSEITEINTYSNKSSKSIFVTYEIDGVYDSVAFMEEKSLTRANDKKHKVKCNGTCDSPVLTDQCIEVFDPESGRAFCDCQDDNCYMIISTIGN